MITYEFKSDRFSGPLNRLLELIEERKLEVTTINLGEVTADFLKYFNEIEEKEEKKPQFLADFIVVASRLILIKSKALLPNLELTHDEEAEIKDLEERLRIYKEFALAKSNIKNFWQEGGHSFEREFLPPVIFYPPSSLKVLELHAVIEKLSQSFQFTPETESAKISMLNFETKLEELALRIKKELQASFKELTRDKDKKEIVVLFLALLYLLKENLIALKQERRFADILITSKKNNAQ